MWGAELRDKETHVLRWLDLVAGVFESDPTQRSLPIHILFHFSQFELGFFSFASKNSYYTLPWLLCLINKMGITVILPIGLLPGITACLSVI